jgi:hypothetical protein
MIDQYEESHSLSRVNQIGRDFVDTVFEVGE